MEAVDLQKVFSDPTNFNKFVEDRDFSSYMNNRKNAVAFLQMLYNKYKDRSARAADVLGKVIREDGRPLGRSIAYLYLFRQAVLDNSIPIVILMLKSQRFNYSTDLLANILEIDSRNSKMFAHSEYLTKEDDAYVLVLDEMERRDPEFFRHYMGFRMLAYRSEKELEVNLIISDQPHLLQFVADLSKMPTLIPSFLEANSGDVYKTEHLRDLTSAAGRYFNREELGDLIVESETASWGDSGGRTDVVQAITSSRERWEEIQQREATFNTLLVKLRDILLDLSDAVPYAEEKVGAAMFEIESYRSPKGEDNNLGYAVDYYLAAVRGRFKIKTPQIPFDPLLQRMVRQ